MNAETIREEVEPGIIRVTAGMDQAPIITFGGFEIGFYHPDDGPREEPPPLEQTLKVLRELLQADSYEVKGAVYWTDDHCDCASAIINGHAVQFWWAADVHALDYADSPRAQKDIRDMLQYAMSVYEVELKDLEEFMTNEASRIHFVVEEIRNAGKMLHMCSSIEQARETRRRLDESN